MGSRMKLLTFFVMMVWILTGAEIVHGDERKKMNPQVVLPSEAAGWKWDQKEMKYNSRTLFDYMDGTAELYLAYGFQNLTVRRFEKSGQSPITVELHEMASSEDAYGVFSFERQDEDVRIGQGSEFGGGLLRFWKGKYFVSVYEEGEGKEVESTVLQLGRDTAASIRSAGPEPKLIRYIPGKEMGLVDRSVRYLKSHVLLNQRFFIAHQNILSLSRKNEAVLAQYLQNRQKVQLLLIRYDHLEEARDAYKSFLKAYLPDAEGKDRLKTEDGKWTIAWQRNEFILIVFGAPTAADGEGLLKATEEKLSGGR